MRLRLLLPLLLLGLAACAGPAAPPDNFHRLGSFAPPERFVRAPLAGVLEVERLAADGALSERAVAFQVREPGPLSHYKYDFWSEAPALMIQDRLETYLTQAGVAERVVTPDLRVLSDWSLRGKVLRFEQVAEDGIAVVSLRLAVVSARDGSLVLLEEYTARVPAAGGDVAAVAMAAERGVADILGRFLKDLGRARPR